MADHTDTGVVYFIASVGSFVYFSQHDNFFLAIVKGLVWPGFLAYYGLKGLGA